MIGVGGTWEDDENSIKGKMVKVRLVEKMIFTSFNFLGRSGDYLVGLKILTLQ